MLGRRAPALLVEDIALVEKLKHLLATACVYHGSRRCSANAYILGPRSWLLVMCAMLGRVWPPHLPAATDTLPQARTTYTHAHVLACVIPTHNTNHPWTMRKPAGPVNANLCRAVLRVGINQSNAPDGPWKLCQATPASLASFSRL